MSARPDRCPACGTQLGPTIVACPRCRRLVHKEELERLATEARAGDDGTALERWRAAVQLVPEGSPQAQRIASRIATLERRAPAGSKSDKDRKVPRWLAGLGAVGVFAWKAKAILAFVLTKGKLLLTGLATWQTALSIVLSFGVYWAAWGWGFALGLIVSVYIHELGHVVALKRFGIPASAPMFIPGVGAFVRLGRAPKNAIEDARTGLAGPWFGLGAALAAGGLYLATDAELLLAIARVGAWINLFNLVPVWQLDGGRGFNSLTRKQRTFAAVATAAAWLISGEALLGVITVAAGLRAFFGKAPAEGDRSGLLQYIFLICAHAALASLSVESPI